MNSSRAGSPNEKNKSGKTLAPRSPRSPWPVHFPCTPCGRRKPQPGPWRSLASINADKVIGKGVELDFQAILTDSLRMTLCGSYNDTEIKDSKLFVQYCGNVNNSPASGCTVTDPAGPFPGTVSINGNPLPRAPKWQGNLTLRYSIPMADGEFYACTDWAYRSTYNMFLYEAKEYTAKSLLEGGLRVGYKWRNYEVAAFSRNITNQHDMDGINKFAYINSCICFTYRIGKSVQ